MTLDELVQEVVSVRKEAEAEVWDLRKRYARNLNTIKRGDVVSDHLMTIEVVSLSFHSQSEYELSCIYTGPRLKKDGSRYKSGELGKVYQMNLKEVNNANV